MFGEVVTDNEALQDISGVIVTSYPDGWMNETLTVDWLHSWLVGDQDKEFVVGGNLQAPACQLLVDWVLKAWENLDHNLGLR